MERSPAGSRPACRSVATSNQARADGTSYAAWVALNDKGSAPKPRGSCSQWLAVREPLAARFGRLCPADDRPSQRSRTRQKVTAARSLSSLGKRGVSAAVLIQVSGYSQLFFPVPRWNRPPTVPPARFGLETVAGIFGPSPSEERRFQSHGHSLQNRFFGDSCDFMAKLVPPWTFLWRHWPIDEYG